MDTSLSKKDRAILETLIINCLVASFKAWDKNVFEDKPQITITRLIKTIEKHDLCPEKIKLVNRQERQCMVRSRVEQLQQASLITYFIGIGARGLKARCLEPSEWTCVSHNFRLNRRNGKTIYLANGIRKIDRPDSLRIVLGDPKNQCPQLVVNENGKSRMLKISRMAAEVLIASGICHSI